MRIEDHRAKIEALQGTLAKLDDEADHETVIEVCVLVCSHAANLGMHARGTLKVSLDIRHNKLPGEIRRGSRLGDASGEVADLLDRLERMRPLHVYGKGRDGGSATLARELAGRVVALCLGGDGA